MLSNRSYNQYWVEQFVGGANIIDKVYGNRIGADKNKYTIALLKAVQNGWIPPVKISEQMYRAVKNNPSYYLDELSGFVGFSAYGGKWFGGYPRCNTVSRYNRFLESANNLKKQSYKLIGVSFICCDYRELDIPENSLIYCDPPYANTTQYKNKFDHKDFWEWCRQKSDEGHKVFISEYKAPKDFVCV